MDNENHRHKDEYNLRQYELMLPAVQDYRGGYIGLSQLVDSLDALQNALLNPPPDWLNFF
jgi:hypothetical protein